MGHFTSGSRYVDSATLTLASSAARTATANGSTVDHEGRSVAYVKLDVTAASGTSPTLDVVVEAQNAAGTWYTVATFTQATGVTAETKAFPCAGRNVRARWTIGGTDTPTFTFSVIGEAYR